MADYLHVAVYDETLHKAGAQLVWHDCGWSNKVDRLETLSADIGAFSRLWLGSSTATALAVTSDFDGPEALLSALDACICLPVPRFDWNF